MRQIHCTIQYSLDNGGQEIDANSSTTDHYQLRFIAAQLAIKVHLTKAVNSNANLGQLTRPIL